MGPDNSLWWGQSWALEDVYSISGLYPPDARSPYSHCWLWQPKWLLGHRTFLSFRKLPSPPPPNQLAPILTSITISLACSCTWYKQNHTEWTLMHLGSFTRIMFFRFNHIDCWRYQQFLSFLTVSFYCWVFHFLVAQTVRNLPVMQETSVQSLGQESREKGMATQVQYFWLKNPMDRGAWWATLYGVTKSWTQLSN